MIGQRRLAFLLLGGFFLRLILQDRLVGLGAHPIQGDAQAAQHFGRDALAFLHQAEQQMLGADERVAQLPCLFDGQLDHVLGARGQRWLAERRARVFGGHPLDGAADFRGRGAHIAQDSGSDAALFHHQPQEEMLRPDVVVIQPHSLFLCELQYLASVFCKAIQVVCHFSSSFARVAQRMLSPISLVGCNTLFGLSVAHYSTSWAQRRKRASASNKKGQRTLCLRPFGITLAHRSLRASRVDARAPRRL